MSRIQRQFGKKLPLAVLFQHPILEQLASVIHQQGNVVPWSPLVAIQPKGSKPPLFGVHPAGGRAFCYVDLARCLGPEQPFYGLQAWGFEDGQKPFFHAKNMAANYIEALRTVQSYGPYHIAGWSGGGVVAFEMAQQLQSAGQEVSFLSSLNSSISQHYRGKIILVRAETEESTASRYSPQDPTLGWGAFATDGVEVCRIPGNHNTMMRKPHVEVLAQRLRRYLKDSRISFSITREI